MLPHALASFFPPLEASDFAKLVTDIRDHGLLHPIVVHEGKVLDGWHRYRACIKAGRKPRYEQFRNGNPLDYVISENVLRRHLTVGQRAVLALELEKKYEAEAKVVETARKAKNGSKFQRAKNGPVGRSAVRAAKALNVGAGTVKDVKFIERKALSAGLNPKKELEDIRLNKKTVHAVADRIRRAVTPRKPIDRSAAQCAHCEIHCPIRYAKGRS